MIIQDILINATLKEFYYTYDMTGEGMIVNHIGGAALYDKIEKEVYKIEISAEDKKTIWNQCKKDYNFWYAQYNRHSVEQQKKKLEGFYKSSLAEFHLNSLLNTKGTGQILSFSGPTDILGMTGVDLTKVEVVKKYKNSIDKLIFIVTPEEKVE